MASGSGIIVTVVHRRILVMADLWGPLYEWDVAGELRDWLGLAGPVLLALGGVVVLVAVVFILPARLARPKGTIPAAERG